MIRKKKGYTLIEFIAYLAVCTILIYIITGMVIELVTFRNNYVKNTIQEDFAVNGIIAIDNIISRAQVKEVKVENNTIRVSYGTGMDRVEIKTYNETDLAMYYYKGNSLSTVNKVIKGVDKVNMYSKNKLIYMEFYINEKRYDEVFKI